jgi:hypothetical protein
MRTENDIREALTTLEREAPSPHQVLAPLTDGGGRRPQRAPILVAVVAATTLAIAGVPALKSLVGNDAEPAGSGDVGWEYTFRVDPATGWMVTSRNIWRTEQLATLMNGPDHADCTVTVYVAGAFDTSRIPVERTPVDVNGHHGYVANIEGLARQLVPGEDGKLVEEDVPVPGLAWEYAPNSWGVSSCGLPMEAGERDKVIAQEAASARAVEVSRQPLWVPYRIGYLPSGWHATTMNDQLLAAPQPRLDLTLRPEGVDEPAGREDESARAATPTSMPNEPPRVSILFTKANSYTPPVDATRTTINGLPAWIWHESPAGQARSTLAAGVYLKGNGFDLRVESVGAAQGFEAELKRIAEDLTLASSPLDESTWFDGTVAIP